jgi:drug/metabolite transporter (DMT)-like permease
LASFVAFVWSTSWILIKIGLSDIPALTFAGLRYFLGFLCLLPFLLQSSVRKQISSFSKAEWSLILLMGVITYFTAQGTQFLSLAYLPATTLSLILNLTSVFVAILAVYLIREVPAWNQWLGLAINLIGVLIFFHPQGGNGGAAIGFIFAAVCLASNTLGTLIGRKVNASGKLNPIAITMVSMGIGSTLMLASGLTWQGLPAISTRSIVIILVLAVVNTAFTFVVWNYTLQTLTAVESSIINNTMMVYIAILAWIFLDEIQDLSGIIGLSLAFIGAIIVNLKFRKSEKNIQ